MAQQREVGKPSTTWADVPNKLWNYAIQTAAYTRCYSRRTKKTPYELFTGKVPNISKLQKFG